MTREVKSKSLTCRQCNTAAHSCISFENHFAARTHSLKWCKAKFANGVLVLNNGDLYAISLT